MQGLTCVVFTPSWMFRFIRVLPRFPSEHCSWWMNLSDAILGRPCREHPGCSTLSYSRWTKGEDGELLHCAMARNEAHWVSVPWIESRLDGFKYHWRRKLDATVKCLYVAMQNTVMAADAAGLVFLLLRTTRGKGTCQTFHTRHGTTTTPSHSPRHATQLVSSTAMRTTTLPLLSCKRFCSKWYATFVTMREPIFIAHTICRLRWTIWSTTSQFCNPDKMLLGQLFV